MARPLTSTNESVRRMISSMPSTPRSAMESKFLISPPSSYTCGRVRWSVSPVFVSAAEGRPPLELGGSFLHLPEVDAVGVHVHHLVPPGGQVLAHVVGADRQLAVAPVDHDRELDGPGPAVVVDRVERGPDGAAGEEHVVDEDDHPAGEVEGDVRGRLGHDRAEADVVAVQGDVES